MMTETQVKERPILFSAPMVNALLRRRKAQTRRKMKSQPYTLRTEGFGYPTKRGGFVSLQSEHCLNECPYGKPGDRLWVRESFGVWRKTSYEYDEYDQGRDALCGMTLAEWKVERGPQELEFCYRADGDDGDTTWFPSIHMPRWASRITLEITEVRVQRAEVDEPEESIQAGQWIWVIDFRRVQ